MIVDEEIDEAAEPSDNKSNGGNSDFTIRTKDVDNRKYSNDNININCE